MLKPPIKIVSLIVLFNLFLGCTSIPKASISSRETSKDTPFVTFKKKEVTTQMYNDDTSMLLILKYTAAMTPVIMYRYEVVDVKTKEQLKKGVFRGKKVEWFDNFSLKCTHHVGMIQKEENPLLLEHHRNNTNYTIIKIK
jgi:hypothetical protein